MKVTNEPVEMTPELQEVLTEYRERRGFNAESWVEEKITLINDYFTQANLSGAVVGVSGGVDSAVALTLLKLASEKAGSNIKKIVPLLLPALNYEGATLQDEATDKGVQLCKTLCLEPAVFTKLTSLASLVTEELESILDLTSTPWARGQLVAYARTPLLYNTASILTDTGNPALIIGTTNLSEGGYLGYVGKASDGMVDLQVISDLYKSEVYAVAEHVGVTDEILNATPTGDMYDGRGDTEVFGAAYDFVELYHLWMQEGSDPALMENETFLAGRENLEKLHAYNGHKYLYGTPSIHLDIMNAKIPGGWNNTSWKEL